MELKNITDEKNLKGKRIILRMNLNVPVSEGAVMDDFRIKKGLPTINLLRDAGARVIIISHIGSDGSHTLFPVYEYLKKELPELEFVSEIITGNDLAEKAKSMKDGGVLLLENLRKNDGEKKNSKAYAQELASLGDIYVNEAFADSHREHASIVGVSQILPSYAGPLFISEVKNLSRALEPKKPFVVIFGGAKISTKMPLVEKFLDTADSIFLYGALANDMYKAKGYEIGKSLTDGTTDVSGLMLKEKIKVPVDIIVERENGSASKDPQKVKEDETIVDAGPESVKLIGDEIKKAKSILWNGPLGSYEKGFRRGTEELARIIADSSAFSIIGGGDTIAAIESLGLIEKFGFVSTGGGATLDFLANGTLPGIEALRK